ncbi:helix-turn-helix domain-containing protein [Cytophagaceae bacterium YF14B1]|uniref:Helix-turn-helix domain-containing protein n=1 Tax=Xanthocytophaga flava TaxID=3048013 RepID=A0AAE3QUT0_9BACT|nr:helix-turn-helix domain-containing protein [Xanthocytophaga flavus]MDJ1483655.1 helix-turn-helix domain-containing protein [Xanthocytophaga flavus]
MPFTILQLLLVAGAAQGFLLAFLLVTRRVNPLASRLLGLLIFLISIQTLLVGFDNREFFLRFPHLSKISWLLPSLFGPLLFLFTRKITSEKPIWKRVDGIHLVPFIVYFFYLLPYYAKSAAEKSAYLNNFEAALQDDFGFLNQLTNFLHLFYATLSLFIVKKYQQGILNSFSDITQIRLRWLRQLLLFVLTVMLISVIIFYAKKWNIGWLTQLYRYHYLGVVALIYWIGYKALSQPRIFNQFELPVTHVPEPKKDESISVVAEEEIPKNKYQKSTLTNDVADTYLKQLAHLMENEKLYLRQELTIQDLAERTGISRHQLSQLINERLEKNFYDFVNEYRVKEAQRMLVDPKYKHLTTLAISGEAGFNSKATFNAVFKKITGQTPSEYIKSYKEVV